MPPKDLNISPESQPSRQAFSQVGALLAQPNLWSDWLAQHPDKAKLLFKDAFSCVVRLRSHTGWSEDEVLEALGCDTKTEAELSQLTEERLRSCLEYMLWVESLLGPSDLALDKRLIVRGATRFFVAANRDLDWVKTQMEQGDFSPANYLALGEVSEAWASAFRRLVGPAGDRARRLHEENPFVDEDTPHMSTMRLKMLTRPDAAELLGMRVEKRMREHLDLCHVCAAVQRQVPGPSSAEAQLAGTP
jgi:hypothetical protein